MKRGDFYCDIGNLKKQKADNKSRLYKHRGHCSWQGIKTEKYKTEYKTEGDDWAGIVRRVLIGSHGESTKFHVRYFEIMPGGYSSFEKHKHEHVVIGVRGEGNVLIGKKIYKMTFLDTLYIAPHAPHQLRNVSDEPFGFFCIVNARRDKPILLTDKR